MARLLEEKGVSEETLHEHFTFKNPEWVAKREGKRQAGGKHTKNLKQITQNDPHSDQIGSYSSIDGGISVKKPKKYCDFTGFHSTYEDPKSHLRYFNKDFYPYVTTIPDSTRDDYLALRKANIVLR